MQAMASRSRATARSSDCCSLHEPSECLHLPSTADGPARFDLQVAGNWPGFKAPSTTGRVQVHSVRIPVAGLNTPLRNRLGGSLTGTGRDQNTGT